MSWAIHQEIGFSVDGAVKDRVRRFHEFTSWHKPSSGSIPGPECLTVTKVPLKLQSDATRRESVLSAAQVARQSLPNAVDVGTDLVRHGSAEAFSTDAPVAFATIEALLSASFRERDGHRPYPSAGKLYPVEIFVGTFADRIVDGPDGTAHCYQASHGNLHPIPSVTEEALRRALFGEGARHFEGAPFFVAYFTIWDVALFKYRHRGYRHALLEIGAMTQQASLVARRLGLSDRLSSAFGDHELARAFRVNPAIASPVTVQFFGVEDRASAPRGG